MSFLIELLAKLLEKENVKIDINLSDDDILTLLEKNCFKALSKIQGLFVTTA